jgi:hypothetical protein
VCTLLGGEVSLTHKTPHTNENKMLPEVIIMFTSFHYKISDYATEKHAYCLNWEGQEFQQEFLEVLCFI